MQRNKTCGIIDVSITYSHIKVLPLTLTVHNLSAPFNCIANTVLQKGHDYLETVPCGHGRSTCDTDQKGKK